MSIAIKIRQPLSKEDGVVLTVASVRNILRKGNKRLERRRECQTNGQTHHGVKTHVPFTGQLPRKAYGWVVLIGREIRIDIRCIGLERTHVVLGISSEAEDNAEQFNAWVELWCESWLTPSRYKAVCRDQSYSE